MRRGVAVVIGIVSGLAASRAGAVQDCLEAGAVSGLEVQVVDSGGGVPLPGVVVIVVAGKLRWEGRTEANGRVRFCQLHGEGLARVTASVGTLVSHMVDVQLDAVGMKQATIRLDLEAAGRARGESSRVMGHVRDAQSLTGISGVAVGTAALGYITVTAVDGAFVLEGVPGGEVTLLTKHVAYGEQRRMINVAGGRVITVELRVGVRAITVEPLNVEILADRSLRLETVGFYERRGWMGAVGLGAFFTRADIEARRPVMLTHLLADVPRVDFLRTCPGSRCVLPVISGTAPSCRGVSDAGDIGPSIYLDGHRLRPGAGVGAGARPTGIDEVVRPADVWGVEVYTGLGDLPGEFADSNAQRCGAIVIWTGSGDD